MKNKAVKESLIADMILEASNDFESMLVTICRYRILCGIKSPKSLYEICAGLADKTGRICRELKHIERNDPHPEAVSKLLSAMAGVNIYMAMIAKKLIAAGQLDCSMGMSEELKKARGQHKK